MPPLSSDLYPLNNNFKIDSDPILSDLNQNTQNIQIYGYNVISDQDRDILNQGTAEHIKKYFDKKQAEHENEMTSITTIIDTHTSSPYSINKIGFFIKLIVLLLFLWMIWDFSYVE